MDSRKEVAYRDTPAFNNVNKSMSCVDLYISEVGIYKGKQESKKTRKQELNQESVQEKKKTRTRPRSTYM